MVQVFEVCLLLQVSKPGMYRLGQVSVEMKQFELLSPRMGCRYKFLVEKVPGKIEITGDNLNLIAGIEQVITLQLFTGSNNIVEVGLQVPQLPHCHYCSLVMNENLSLVLF